MAAEKRLQNAILREFGSVPWCRLWRQNTGRADLDGRWIAFGLPGCADLSGLVRGGLRLEIEVKGPRGRQTKTQIQFQRMVEALDGIYILAHSIDDVRLALEPYARLYQRQEHR